MWCTQGAAGGLGHGVYADLPGVRRSCDNEVVARGLIEWAVDRQRFVLVFVALVTVALGAGLVQLEAGTGPDAFIIEGSPEHQGFELFREKAGVQDQATILVRVEDPFDLDTLARLEQMQSAVELVPHSVRVRSILSLGDFRESDFRTIVSGVPAAQGRLFSDLPDNEFVAVSVSLASFDEVTGERLSFDQVDDHARGLLSIVADNNDDGFSAEVFSNATLGAEAGDSVSLWLGVGIALLVVAIVALLWFMYRSWRAAVLPLLIIALSLIWTMGLMGHFGVGLNAFTQVLVMLIIVAGVADGVHALHSYARHSDQGGDGRQVASDAVVQKGPAIMFTSLTTAGGFISFVFVDYEPLAQIGLFGAIGVVFAMLLTLTLGPLVLEYVVGSSISTPKMFDAPLRRVVTTSYNNRWVVLGLTCLLIVGSGFGINRVNLGFDVLGWLGNSEAGETIETLEALSGGTGLVEVLVLRPEGQDPHAPEFVDRLREIDAFVIGRGINGQDVERVSSVLSLYDLGGLIDFEELQVTALEEGMVSQDGTTVRMTYASSFFDEVQDGLSSADLEAELQQFVGGGERVVLTGSHLGTLRSASTALETTVASYGVALVVVSLLLVLMLKSFSRGLVSMIPNVLPAVVLLGAMGALGIAVDPVTIIAGGIVIGISVDDTVHLTHATFQSSWSAPSADARLDNLLRATTDAGTSIFITSVITMIGFATFLTFPLPGLRLLGWLAGSAVLAALIADLIVLPALLSLLNDVRGRTRSTAAQPA